MNAWSFGRRAVCVSAMAALAGCGETNLAGGITVRAAERALSHRPSVVEETIYSFGSHTSDGWNPQSALINVNGTLYGTTDSGGAHRGGKICGRAHGCGAVFTITPSGTETVLYSFAAGGHKGANPEAGLVNVDGTLYGTTAYGGAKGCVPGYGCGTVFSVTTTGTEKVHHRFNGSSGKLPQAALIDVNGTFYGTTEAGGASSYGTVFSIAPTGAYQVLHSFGGGRDGEYPDAGLTNVDGKLYGTTSGGGRYGSGTVFSVTTTGTEKVLHAFNGSDGRYPKAGLTNVNGKIYGTISAGGGSGGYGAVFSITTTGTEKVLYRFAGGSDGAYPLADLINVNGTLYGTTQKGGGKGCGGGGCGTVFSITPSGMYHLLHSFEGESNADGAYPQAALINVEGTLFGTTDGGGKYAVGTVFSLSGF